MLLSTPRHVAVAVISAAIFIGSAVVAVPPAGADDEPVDVDLHASSAARAPQRIAAAISASGVDPCRDGCEVADRVVDQWYLDAIGAPEGPVDDVDTVVVAVLDGGVMLDHPEMVGRVRRAACAPVEATDLLHGTAIAGLLVAGHHDTVGLAPAVPGLNVLDVPVYVEDDFETTTSSSIVAAAIDCAVAEGADVVNLSFSGGCGQTDELEAATRRAVAAGVSVVAAAGNDPGAGEICPAIFDSVVGVAASDAGGNIATGTVSAELAAPGIDVLTLGIHHRAPHVVVSGSSFATPLVAAALADLARRHPEWTPERRLTRLRAVATPGDVLPVLRLDDPDVVPPGFLAVDTSGAVVAVGDAMVPADWSTVRGDVVDDAVGWTANCTGWWRVDAAGRVAVGGGGSLHGGLGAFRLDAPVVDIEVTSSGAGYWMVAGDGGVFAFGDAPFLGSMGGVRLDAPVVDLLPTASGRGYWLLAADGGVFAFGDARYQGTVSTTSASALVRFGEGYGIVVAEGVITFPVLSFTPKPGGIDLAAAAMHGDGGDAELWFLGQDLALHSGDGTGSVDGTPLSAVLRATHTATCADLPTTPTS